MDTCKRGHPKTDVNWYVRPNGYGFCRPCSKVAKSKARDGRNYRAARTAEMGPYTPVSMTKDQLKVQYEDAIIRAYSSGMWSKEEAEKALTRVKNLSE